MNLSRKIAVTFVFCLFVVITHGQNCDNWTTTFLNSEISNWNCLQYTDSIGNSYLLDQANDPRGVVLKKVSPHGLTLWTRYENAHYINQPRIVPWQIEPTPDGDIVILGEDIVRERIAILKYSPDGTQLLDSIYTTFTLDGTPSRALAVDHDNNIIIAPKVLDTITSDGILVNLAKISPNGNVIWNYTLYRYYQDASVEVIVGHDNHIYVSVDSYYPPNINSGINEHNDLYRVKPDGFIDWRKDLTPHNFNLNYYAKNTNGLHHTPQGHIYAVSQLDGEVFKLDTTGQVLWQYSTGFQVASASVVTEQEDILVLAQGRTPEVQKISAAGNLLWTYSSPPTPGQTWYSTSSLIELPNKKIVYGGALTTIPSQQVPPGFYFTVLDSMGQEESSTRIVRDSVSQLSGPSLTCDAFSQVYFLGGFQSSRIIKHFSRFCLDSVANNVQGKIFWDQNRNCTQDSNERVMPYASVLVNPGSWILAPDTLGNFEGFLLPGNYTFTPVTPSNFSANCTNSQSYSVNINSFSDTHDSIDFPISAPDNIEDLQIRLYCGRARPGIMQQCAAIIENRGTVPSSPRVEISFDSIFSMGTANVPPDSIVGNSAFFSLPQLDIFQQKTIGFPSVTAALGSSGQEYTHNSTVAPITYDINPADNHSSFSDTIRASFDPNDKVVNPGGKLTNLDTLLHYTIRFQNTGTDTAFTVIIRDSLPSELDLSTFEMTYSSHPVVLSGEPGNVLVWTFDDILLPDSTSNEPESHGMISFSIRPKTNLPIGTEIGNKVYIYFDFNEPVITNTTWVSLILPEPPPPVKSFQLFPNPAHDKVHLHCNLQAGEPILVLSFDAFGRKVMEIETEYYPAMEIPLSSLSTGLYFFRVKGEGFEETRKILIRSQ